MRQVVVSKLSKTRHRERPRQRWLYRVKKDLFQINKLTFTFVYFCLFCSY